MEFYGESSKALAQKIGRKVATVRSWLRGEREPGVRAVDDILSELFSADARHVVKDLADRVRAHRGDVRTDVSEKAQSKEIDDAYADDGSIPR